MTDGILRSGKSEPTGPDESGCPGARDSGAKMSGVRGWAVAIAVSIASVLIFPVASASATTYRSIQVAGAVRCNNGAQNVVGVWVNSSLGGSKWATWIPSSYTGAANPYAVYTAELKVPWSSSTKSTNIQIRVGCGGNASTWGSTNRTPAKPVSGSTLLSATCANPAKLTHADAVTCATASNGADAGAISSALWALAQIKATKSGSVTPNGYWAGYCAAFVARAWGRTAAGYLTATSMYNGFKQLDRKPSTSSAVPVGALAFYGLAKSIDPDLEGHVNIQVGLGVFVSTKGFVGDKSPIVAYRVSQYANSTHKYLGWMIPPSSWRAR